LALSVLEAVDNLSEIAELTEQTILYVSKEGKEREKETPVYKWLDPKRQELNKDRIKETFNAVREYLERLYDSDAASLGKEETQQGIESIMNLVDEASEKADRHISMFVGGKEKSIKQLKEYRDLHNFYLNKVARRFLSPLMKPEKAVEVEKRLEKGLRDLEAVKRDQNYELFYFPREDGRPFFDRAVMRHIRLVGEFDRSFEATHEEDPLLQVKGIIDVEMCETAKAILKLAAPHIDEFYKEGLKQRAKEFVSLLNRAVMALMLAANSRNLMYNTDAKSSSEYFRDFQTYLRLALKSDQYQKLITTPAKKEDYFSRVLLNLSHLLCCFFFFRISLYHQTLDLIQSLGRGQQEEKSKKQTFWEMLKERDQNIRQLLMSYPSGPLMKALDLLQEGRKIGGFDPVTQNNLPSQLYVVEGGDMHITALRLPCPTQQTRIDEAEVILEFQGLLRYFQSRLKKQKHLLFNLQDRTTWQEHARCVAIEKLSKNEEFAQNFIVVSLSKNTDFYHQKENYRELNNAADFKKQLEGQILSGAVAGFYFPPQIDSNEFNLFLTFAIDLVHEHFFGSRNVLSLKERLDFIEVIYLLIAFKCIELISPDSISFTDKDGIDAASATTVEFYCLLTLLARKDPWTDKEREFILWMLYAPALLIRERSIIQDIFDRFHSALSYIDSEKKSLPTLFTALFSKTLLKKLSIKKAA
jgi:hypothetical protein